MSLPPRQSSAIADLLWSFAPVVAQELAEALGVYRALCQRNGRPVGAGLSALADDLAASRGQERTAGSRGGVPVGENGSQQLLDTEEVARVLGISPRSVRRRINDGDLTSVRIGRSLRVHPDDLTDYIEANRT